MRDARTAVRGQQVLWGQPEPGRGGRHCSHPPRPDGGWLKNGEKLARAGPGEPARTQQNINSTASPSCEATLSRVLREHKKNDLRERRNSSALLGGGKQTNTTSGAGGVQRRHAWRHAWRGCATGCRGVRDSTSHPCGLMRHPEPTDTNATFRQTETNVEEAGRAPHTHGRTQRQKKHRHTRREGARTRRSAVLANPAVPRAKKKHTTSHHPTLCSPPSKRAPTRAAVRAKCPILG